MDKTIKPSTRRALMLPMAAAAIALAAGILLGGETMQIDLAAEWWLGLGLLSWMTIVTLPHDHVKALASGTLILATGAASITYSYSTSGNDFSRITSRMARNDAALITVSGRIHSFVIEDSAQIKFTFEMERIHAIDRVVPINGLARTTISIGVAASGLPDGQDARLRDGCRDMRRGMRVVLHGRAFRPDRNMNPADFDYRKYLSKKGIGTLIFVRKLKDCRRVHINNTRSDWIASIRFWFKSAVRTVVPGSATALSTALITGDRSGLDASTRRQFAESGLMHLLAISGLHVLFVGLSAYGLIKSMLFRFRFEWRMVEAVSTSLTLGLLCMYTLITGAAPSVVRALEPALFLQLCNIFSVPKYK